jgi:CheY-like chemotaxis protein
MLVVHCLTPMEAASGPEALHVLAEHPEVRLMISDYDMPEMDGVSLVRAIRALYPKDRLAIIGISGYDQKKPLGPVPQERGQ